MKMETRPMIKPGKPALGHGIEEITKDNRKAAEQKKGDPEQTTTIHDKDFITGDIWSEFAVSPAPTTEEEITGEAIPAIIRILAELPEAQCANVFAAVQAIRQTARRSSNEITRIGDELNRIERDKARREAAPKKKGWLW